MVFTGKLIDESASSTSTPPPNTSSSTPPPPPPPPTPKKKSHLFRNLILSTLGLTIIAYGGGVYYSLDNDEFRDEFSERVPFGEDLVYFIEEQRFKRKFSGVLPSIASIPSSDDSPSTITSSKTTGTASRASDAAPAWKASDSENSPAAAKILKSDKQKRVKAVEPVAVTSSTSKPSSSSPPAVPLPLIRVPAGVDTAVAKSIESLNQFIKVVNDSKASPVDVEKLSTEILALVSTIDAIKASTEAEAKKLAAGEVAKAEQRLESNINELKTAVSAQEEKWTREYHEETKRLAHAYNERLQNEVNAANKVIFAHANNQLLAVHAAREREFAKQIQERVETERSGRLSKLEDLAKELAEIQELTTKAEKTIADSDRAAKLQLAITRLRIALDSDEPVPLAPYFASLRELTTDTNSTTTEEDSFLSTVLNSVPDDALTQGVLSPAQLSARFHLLEPEIRKASLLPANAGVAGHVGSIIFSKLLWKKSGNATGDDVESILARADTALTEGRVTDAVAEVNSLKGWPKKLAGDWLFEGRKRSEVEFLTDVLTEEGKLWL